MTFQAIFWSIAAVAMLIVLPIVMIWGMVDHFRKSASERGGSGGISAGIGAALLDLDRLTRPSIEHHIESEQHAFPREDDKGGA